MQHINPIAKLIKLIDTYCLFLIKDLSVNLKLKRKFMLTSGTDYINEVTKNFNPLLIF